MPMVIKWVRALLEKQAPVVRHDSPPAPEKPQNPAVPLAALQNIYPPEDPGLPVRSVEELIAGNSDIIARLRLHAATEKDRFEIRYLLPIQRLAEHINSLPGTPSHLFSGEGGLFRACVELGFLSFQAADGRIFTANDTVERRHALEPKWRYLCFAAGLLYPLGKPLMAMVVTAPSGASWPKHMQGLKAWADQVRAGRVFVSWPELADAAQQVNGIGPSPYTAAVVNQIIGMENLTWLDNAAPDLTRVLYELITGSPTDGRSANEVLSTVWHKVCQREAARRPQTYGRMTVGTHLGPYLVGALRDLHEDGTWKINENGLFADAKGLYLVWSQAGDDLVRYGQKKGLAGWPSSPALIAELLKSAGIFETAKANDRGLMEVVSGDGEVLSAYKVKVPETIVDNWDPSQYVKKAPKTLEGVLDNDPLVKAERANQAARAAREAPAATPTAVDSTNEKPVEDSAAPTEDDDTGNIVAGDHLGGETAEEVEAVESQPDGELSDGSVIERAESEPAKDRAPRRPRQERQATQEQPKESGKIAEAQEVRYSDLVPPDVRKDMRSQLGVELLGKLMKAWNERTDNNTSMRMTDNGAAISMEFLGTIVFRIPDFVTELAEAGLVFTPSDKPGLKVQEVAIPEGGKTRKAVVISRYGCRKLGLS